MKTITNAYGKHINFEATINLMDDEIREAVHNVKAPCTAQEFFDSYAVAHLVKFGEEFEPAKKNPVW
jgi:hypothetical protein